MKTRRIFAASCVLTAVLIVVGWVVINFRADNPASEGPAPNRARSEAIVGIQSQESATELLDGESRGAKSSGPFEENAAVRLIREPQIFDDEYLRARDEVTLRSGGFNGLEYVRGRVVELDRSALRDFLGTLSANGRRSEVPLTLDFFSDVQCVISDNSSTARFSPGSTLRIINSQCTNFSPTSHTFIASFLVGSEDELRFMLGIGNRNFRVEPLKDSHYYWAYEIKGAIRTE